MRIDIIIGILAIAFGGIYSLQAFQLPRATIGNPLAPIYFPLGLGALMIIIGIIMLVTELAAGIKSEQPKKHKEKDSGYAKLIIGTSIICLVYAAILEHAGFIPSTILFLGGIMFLVNGLQAWKMNSVVTLSFTLGIWYVFNQVLAISLP